MKWKELGTLISAPSKEVVAQFEFSFGMYDVEGAYYGGREAFEALLEEDSVLQLYSVPFWFSQWATDLIEENLPERAREAHERNALLLLINNAHQSYERGNDLFFADSYYFSFVVVRVRGREVNRSNWSELLERRGSRRAEVEVEEMGRSALHSLRYVYDKSMGRAPRWYLLFFSPAVEYSGWKDNPAQPIAYPLWRDYFREGELPYVIGANISDEYSLMFPKGEAEKKIILRTISKEIEKARALERFWEKGIEKYARADEGQFYVVSRDCYSDPTPEVLVRCMRQTIIHSG